MAVETQDRWTEIRKIHVDWAYGYRLLGGLVLVLIGIWLGSLLFAQQQGYDMNLYTEIMGVVVTVAVIDTFNRRRDERRREDDLKSRLVREAASVVNDTAVRAVGELRVLGWLTGDNGALAGAYLVVSDIAGAYLQNANLAGADLRHANLEGVNLDEANLAGADLRYAILAGAELRYANLAGAELEGANLEGVNLWGANLEGADLGGVRYDKNTLLPNGPTYTGDTDMDHFTNPDHVDADGKPDFWRSVMPSSPAYRGDDTDG